MKTYNIDRKDIQFFFIFVNFVLLVSISQNALAQSGENQSIPTTQNQFKFGLYQGSNIKLFSLSGPFNTAQWIPIDNASSKGYEIKSILSYNGRLIVVMQK